MTKASKKRCQARRHKAPPKVAEVKKKAGLNARFSAYYRLVRLDKPIGIMLLLWPALWALWFAGEGHPRWGVVLIFIAGVILMRSAGCAINDFADRKIDGEVERTRQRLLITGEVSAAEALGVFIILSLLAFALVLLLNRVTLYISVVAVLLAASYPFMKRYTHLPQLVLGMAFGCAVPMAFTALTGSVSPLGWLLFCATVVWTLVYDTEYAMVDREDDLRIGVKSSAILFAEYDRLLIGLLQILMLLMLIAVGAQAGRGWLWYGGLFVAALFGLRQQYLIRDRQPQHCFAAFINNNCLGMSIFIGLLLDYIVNPAVAV
ncbi:MAG: 4-hydroxybenzoate octaprenyltransferase [gamma proteobacterium symbiont of Bathyaustriella thionipta]|nr:4-hydroxybenzoate octaprenyltransferase [gamma proteobacterium symbiont of Bathyaustriella thionipta]